MSDNSIFQTYYSQHKFHDRRQDDYKQNVDVIIPLINTNELWETNLFSFYREIPINRLLIGDGGCTDNSISIVKKFPRVHIIEQTDYHSQGYCIKELIEKVETDWFVYLHADVYLPDGWYDEMKKHQGQFDWFECHRKMTTMVEYWSEKQHSQKRAFSGSQMGRKQSFQSLLPRIQDDYLQRNEDIIFAELIKENGYKYGRISGTFHYHQIMNRRGDKEPKFNKIKIEKEADPDWEFKIAEMQVKGIVKYLQPKPYLINMVNNNILKLLNNDSFLWNDFKKWVKKTNPCWEKYISRKKYWLTKIASKVKPIIKKIYEH